MTPLTFGASLFFVVKSLLMYCRMFSSISGHQPLEANGPPTLSVTTKCLQILPKVPCGDKVTRGDPLVQAAEARECAP